MLGLVLGGMSLSRALAETAPPRDPFAEIAAVPAAVEFARMKGIPLSTIRPARGQSGDFVVLLLALYDGTSSLQWLARISIDDLTSDERKRGRPEDEIRHTTSGSELRFSRNPVALQIYFAGPFDPALSRLASRTVSERTGRVIVDGDDLRRGFVAFSQTALSLKERIHRAGLKGGSFWISAHRFPERTVAEGRRQAAAIAMTEDDERRVCEVLLSLTAFYEAGTTVPAFAEVLERVVEKPSLWSIAGHLGLRATITYPWDGEGLIARDASAGPPALFQIPVELNFNGKPALRAWLAVGVPRPPLHVSAGVLGVYAEHPSDPQKRLYIRTVAGGAESKLKE
jgi:hypothetical protein